MNQKMLDALYMKALMDKVEFPVTTNLKVGEEYLIGILYKDGRFEQIDQDGQVVAESQTSPSVIQA